LPQPPNVPRSYVLPPTHLIAWIAPVDEETWPTITVPLESIPCATLQSPPGSTPRFCSVLPRHTNATKRTKPPVGRSLRPTTTPASLIAIASLVGPPSVPRSCFVPFGLQITACHPVVAP